MFLYQSPHSINRFPFGIFSRIIGKPYRYFYSIKAVYKIAPNSGDEAGYLDGVFKADEEPDEDGVIHPAVTPEPAKPTTRAAAAVKAAAPQPTAQPEIMDAEIVDDYTPPDYSDDDMPM